VAACRGIAAAAGEAHAFTKVAASSSVKRHVKSAARLMNLPASSPSVGGKVTPPGQDAGQCPHRGERHHHRGQPLSQVATPKTPTRRQRRISRLRTMAASFDTGDCPSCRACLLPAVEGSV